MTDAPSDRADRIAALVEDDAIPADDEGAVFAAPWQARVFGLALAFHDRREEYDWAEFQAELADAVADADPRAMRDDVESVYYRRWLDRFEELLTEEGIVSPEELDRRQAAFSEGERDASEFVEGDTEH